MILDRELCLASSGVYPWSGLPSSSRVRESQIVFVIILRCADQGFFVTAAGFPRREDRAVQEDHARSRPLALLLLGESCAPSLDVAAMVHDLQELADHAVVEAV